MGKLKTVCKDKKTKLITIKINLEESSKIRENAKKWTNGNISEWIRYSAINLEPNKSDLID